MARLLFIALLVAWPSVVLGEDFCGDETPYNPFTHQCCGESVYPLTPGLECCGDSAVDNFAGIFCCGDSAFDSSTHGCCDGSVYDLSVSGECCGGSIADHSLGQFCCNDQIYTQGTHECCNGETVYPLLSHECCNGETVFDKAEGQCCVDHVVYHADGEYCCNGVAYAMPGEDCCGGIVYNTATHKCCEEVVPKAVVPLTDCCSICSDGVCMSGTCCSGVCGDPIFFGLDNVVYHFQGEVNRTFALISDKTVQVNSKFVPSWHVKMNTVLGDTCIRWCDEAVKVNVNGSLEASPGAIVHNAPFTKNVSEIGLTIEPGNHIQVYTQEKSMLMVITPGGWVFTVAKKNGRLDIDSVKYFGHDGTAQGVLGQTLNPKVDRTEHECNDSEQGGCEVVGSFKDYEVDGDVCSTNWKYSMFSKESCPQ